MGSSLIKDTGIETSQSSQLLTASWRDDQTTSFTDGAERRYKYGTSIPRFHERKRRGELLPHTPFTQVEWEGGQLSGSYFNRTTQSGEWTAISNYQGPDFGVPYRVGDFVNNDCDPTKAPDRDVPDYMVQQAASRIYASGFDALTATAEARKTVDGFRGVAGRMANLARKFSAKRMYKLWLEGRYGFRTLAYDVHDLQAAVTEFDKQRRIWTERSGLSYTESDSTVLATHTGGVQRFTLTRDVVHTFSLRGSVAGLIEVSQFRANPIDTAWELVPYSFVVDWVYGVGTALQALAFQTAASSWTASKGYQCESKVDYVVTSQPLPGNTGHCNVTWSYSGVRQNRSPVSRIATFPQPTNRVLSPDLLMDLQALSQVRSKFR